MEQSIDQSRLDTSMYARRMEQSVKGIQPRSNDNKKTKKVPEYSGAESTPFYLWKTEAGNKLRRKNQFI